MKLSFPAVASIFALALGGAAFHLSLKATAPRQITSSDWLATLPKVPGAHRYLPLSDDLELQGYSGFRLFARLPAIDAKLGQQLYYLFGTNVYQGPRGQLRLVQKGIGLKDIFNAGGAVPLTEAGRPLGFEYTVFYRRDEARGGIAGFNRFGFISAEGRSSSGGPFFIKAPPGSTTGHLDLGQIEAGKEVEFAEYTFAASGPNGQDDHENATTIKWFFVFQPGSPRASAP